MEPRYLEDQFKTLYTFVNLEDRKVRDAINFVRGVITYALRTQPYYIPKYYNEKPWVYFIPARNQKEEEDRDLIIETYKNAKKHQIQYYMLLHHCDAFVVLLWTVLRSNGVKSKIINEPDPEHHAYCEDEYGNIIDPLFEFCGVDNYKYNPSRGEKFDPLSYSTKRFISLRKEKEVLLKRYV